MSSSLNNAEAAEKAPANRKGDLTQGPILKTLVLFALPTLLSNSLQSLNGTINAIWVGRLIGEAALAATANANIIMFLLSSAAFGFGMAGTVRIGQRFGANDLDGARRTMGTAMGFCFLVTIAIAAIGLAITPWLLRMLSTPPEAFQLAVDYLRMVFIAMPMVMISIILTMGLRGAGDSRTPLIFMGVSVVLHTVINPLLIMGYGPLPAFGIAGSSLSMAISTTISFIGMVAYVYAKDLPLRLRGAELAYLKPRVEELGFIIKKGFPMGAQMLVMSAAGLIVVGLVNREGMMTTAAYGATMQVFTYVQMPAMAIGGAISAMAAQYIGAQQWGRLHHLTRAGLITNGVLTGALTVLLLLFDRPILELFMGPESPAVDMARHIQFMVAWNFILFGMTMVLNGTMRAGGVVWLPLFILAITLYPVRLGFYYLAYPAFQADAIWLSFPVAAISGLAMTAYLYYRTPWRERAKAETAGEAAEQSNAEGDPAGRSNPSI